MRRHGLALSAATSMTVAALLSGAPARAQELRLQRTSCVACHSDTDIFEEERTAIVRRFAEDVHAEAGLSCHDCHGGNPDPTLADDLDSAMSEDYGPNPYRGTWDATEIPEACGRCHSDPEYMRRFRPDMRVDQVTEYWTSQHGEALAEGDTKVATCVSCHGTHGIRPPRDPASPVYPMRVAETCGGCHSDPQHMEGYTGPGGGPLPVSQLRLWSASVHAEALLERNDLSAPTCNDCHGNHGAAPPGVESLAYVCGQCHVRESRLFLQSPKFAGLEEHNEFMADAETCGECHEAPEPAAEITDIPAFLQCAVCHTHHAIVRPTIAMFAPLPDTPCAFCHEGPAPAIGSDAGREGAELFAQTRDGLLEQAAALGLEGEARFDWLVGRALELPTHIADTTEVTGTGEEDRLSPEFAELFRKLRIGKTHFTVTDPETGETTTHEVVRCSKCHAEEPLFTDPEGLTFATEYLHLMQEAATRTGHADRLVNRARRAGVPTRDAREHISQAIDAQISTQALLHSYTLGEDSELRERFSDAVEHAQMAIEAGETALAELERRRRGLATSLVLILAVLVGLGLKIRQIG